MADEDDPWLDADQQRSWRSLVKMMMTLPALLESDLQERCGLTTFEYLVLAGLSESPGRSLRLSELAGRANSSLSRLSHVVSRLEKRQLVARRACAGDGRATEAVLTDAGWDVVVETAPVHVRAVRRAVIDPLTPTQLRQLGTISQRITDAAAAAPPDGEGSGSRGR